MSQEKKPRYRFTASVFVELLGTQHLKLECPAVGPIKSEDDLFQTYCIVGEDIERRKLVLKAVFDESEKLRPVHIWVGDPNDNTHAATFVFSVTDTGAVNLASVEAKPEMTTQDCEDVCSALALLLNCTRALDKRRTWKHRLADHLEGAYLEFSKKPRVNGPVPVRSEQDHRKKYYGWRHEQLEAFGLRLMRVFERQDGSMTAVVGAGSVAEGVLSIAKPAVDTSVVLDLYHAGVNLTVSMTWPAQDYLHVEFISAHIADDPRQLFSISFSDFNRYPIFDTEEARIRKGAQELAEAGETLRPAVLWLIERLLDGYRQIGVSQHWETKDTSRLKALNAVIRATPVAPR